MALQELQNATSYKAELRRDFPCHGPKTLTESKMKSVMLYKDDNLGAINRGISQFSLLKRSVPSVATKRSVLLKKMPFGQIIPMWPVTRCKKKERDFPVSR